MNKYQLIGVVTKVTTTDYTKVPNKPMIKTKFTFIHKKGNSTHYINCGSWSTGIATNLKDGMIVELVDYIPCKFGYTCKQTGLKKYFDELEVHELIQVGQEQPKIENSGFSVQKDTYYNPTTDETPIQQQENIVGETPQDETKEQDPDTVNLDWLKDFSDY